ncbi:MAG: metallophosphatase family protein [Bacteroidales bacterium]|nr:metallophosphatase family protein [Bacteroidales bacterium]
MKIGVLSDTHGYLDKKIFGFFKDCDEIWHAGDIGDFEIYRQLRDFKPIVAVYGNIDGSDIRIQLKEHERLERSGVDIWMTHIGGYPGYYERKIKDHIIADPPDLFISGHSHILKVLRDPDLRLLHINPGAAGKHGLHKVRTAVRFAIKERKITDLDIIELGYRSAV